MGIKDSHNSNFRNKEWINSSNKIQAFVKHTTQQHYQLLIIGNRSWKYDYDNSTMMHCSYVHVGLQLGEATIHRARSLDPK